MTLSPDQIARRKQGITATDVAPIVGLDPWRSAIDVWLDKTGRKPAFVGNEATHWGNLLEPTIRDDYAQRRRVRVEVPGTLEHPCVSWALATPDGICYAHGASAPSNGLEIKTHTSRVADLYGEQGTDEVPRHELIQCMWNMYVSGLDSWDLIAFIDNRPRDYRIRRDDHLIELLADESERFLINHVQRDVAPEPDGSAGYDKYLALRWPRSNGDILSVNDDKVALSALAQLRLARERMATCEREVDALVQQIKLVIGQHDGVQWIESGKQRKLTYKSCETHRTDWAGAFAELITQLKEPEATLAKRLVEQHTTTSEGARRFVVPRAWSGNKEE